MTPGDPFGRSSLWHAAAEGDLDLCSALVAAGANPSVPDRHGFTPLHVAAQNGHVEAARALLAAGAAVEASDRHGNRPLWTACREASLATAGTRQMEMVSLLLRAGADQGAVNRAGATVAVWGEASAALDALLSSQAPGR